MHSPLTIRALHMISFKFKGGGIEVKFKVYGCFKLIIGKNIIRKGKLSMGKVGVGL